MKTQTRNLQIAASGFPDQTQYNGNKTPDVSELRCMQFAMTVGLPFLKAGIARDAHALTLAPYKAPALKVAIDFTGTQLTMPSQYSLLDPSEKSNVSFWTGMTFAAIAADEILHVPRLLHAASMLRQNIIKSNPDRRSLADFIGDDSKGKWHVIEAKAWQQIPSSAKRENWKGQAQTVATIDGSPPLTRSYCYTHVESIYTVELVDPPARNATLALSFPHGDRDIIDTYYGSWRNALRTSNLTAVRNNRTIRLILAAFDLADNEYVFVGMDEVSLSRVLDNVLPEPVTPYDGADCYIGSDGIVVLTSNDNIPSLVETHSLLLPV